MLVECRTWAGGRAEGTGKAGKYWEPLAAARPSRLAGLRPRQAVLSVTKEIAENKRWSWLSAEPWEGSAKAEPGACARLLSSSDYTFHDVWQAL